MAWDFVRQLIEQGFEPRSRSTVLTALLTMAGILAAAMLISGGEHTRAWMPIFFAILFTCDFGVFLWAYLYFGRRDPELLRTERYLEHKLAIEHRLVGDKLTGVIDARAAASLADTIEEAPKQIEAHR